MRSRQGEEKGIGDKRYSGLRGKPELGGVII